MEVRVSGDVGVNCELATGPADRIITIPLNEGENMIQAKVTDIMGYSTTRTIQVVHYDAGCNYSDADSGGMIDLPDQEDGAPPDSCVDQFGRARSGNRSSRWCGQVI